MVHLFIWANVEFERMAFEAFVLVDKQFVAEDLVRDEAAVFVVI